MSCGTGAFCLLWGEYKVPWISAFLWLLFCLREARVWFQQSLSSDSLILLSLSASLLNSCTRAGLGLSPWSCLTQLLSLLHPALVTGSAPHSLRPGWELCLCCHMLSGECRGLGVCAFSGCHIWAPSEGMVTTKGAHLLGRVTAPFLCPGHSKSLVTLPGLRLVGDLFSFGDSQVSVALTATGGSEEVPVCWDLSLCHGTDQPWSSFPWRVTVRFLYATF